MRKDNGLVIQIYHTLEQHGVDNAREKGKEYNFVHESNLDSFELLSFIIDLEALLEIEFTPEELTSSSVQTIGGLADLIEQKVQSGGAKQ